MSFIIRKEYFGALIIDNRRMQYYRTNSAVLDVLKNFQEIGFYETRLKYNDFKEDFNNLIIYLRQIKIIDRSNNVAKLRFVDKCSNMQELSAPLKVFIEVTGECNLRCKHCFNASGKKFSSELTLIYLENIVKELYEMGVPTVKVTGGEPFLRKDIFNFFDLLEKYEINFIIHTNGILINDENALKLKKYKFLKAIRISIDGDEETNDFIRGSYSYKNGLKGINYLKKYSIPTGVNLTLNKLNYKGVYKLLKNINSNYGLDVNIGTSKFSGRFFDSIDDLEFRDNLEFNKSLVEINSQINRIRKDVSNFNIENPVINELESDEKDNITLFSDRFACMAGTISCTIKSNGDVFPCGLFFDNSEFNCGNLMNTSLKQIWDKSHGMNLLRNVKINDDCAKCKYVFKKCTGGCRGNAFNYNGSLSSLDPHCRAISYSLLGY